MTPQYPPFTDVGEVDEWTYTTDARIACASCGEWVYPRRKGDSGPFALPATCPVCDGLVVGPEPDRDDTHTMGHG